MSVSRTPRSYGGQTLVGSGSRGLYRRAHNLGVGYGSRLLSAGIKRGAQHLMTKITKKAKKALAKKPTGYNEVSRSDRAAKVINRYNKKVSMKKPQRVKVSRKFKAKVNKALEPQMSKGKYEETSVFRQNFPIAFGNKQISGRFAPNTGDGSRHALFGPAEILDKASCLFNNRVAGQTVATQTGNDTNFGNASLDPRTAKITVNYQKYQCTLRNNSQRTWIIQLYEASPKRMMNVCADADVLSQWESAMINEFNNDAGNAELKKINLANATPNTLYATPFMAKAFMKDWNIEKHDIILDPGQVYDHVMYGPTGTYDFSKFWRSDGVGASNEFYNLQPKFTRELFYTARLDLCATDTGAVGRWGINDTTTGLIHEMTKTCSISVPQQAGGVLTETGGLTAFRHTQQRDAYIKIHWNENATAVPTVRVDVQTAGDNL